MNIYSFDRNPCWKNIVFALMYVLSFTQIIRPLTSHSDQIYKFSQASLAELARNSVIQSGFEMEVKRHWLGQKWYLPGAAGNDIHKVSTQTISVSIFALLSSLTPYTWVVFLHFEFGMV
jgi:hypothetical protein